MNHRSDQIILAAPGGAQPAPAQPAEANVLKVLHRLLRGRYLFAFILIPLCALLGAAAGFYAGATTYSSTGIVRIRPVLPRILYDTEQSSLPPMFTSFVSTQSRLFTTERVILRALEDEVLRRAYGDEPMPVPAEFTQDLIVYTERDVPELIFVSFSHPTPRVAHAAVGAVIRSYMELFGNESSLRNPETITALEGLRREIQGDIRAKTAQIRQLAAEWPSDDLAPIQEAEFRRLEGFQTQIAELRAQLRRLEVEAAAVPEEGVAIDPGASIDDIVAALAEYDPQIATLAESREQLIDDRQRLEAAGATPQHRQLLSITDTIARYEQTIRERAASVAPNAGVKRREQLERQRQMLTAEIATLEDNAGVSRAEIGRVGGVRQQIASIQDEIAKREDDLSQVQRRLDAILLESRSGDSVSGRISVVSTGSVPSLPTVDSRRKRAAMGFVLGGGLPFAALLALGLLDRRVRYADEVEPDDEPTPRLLAVIPRVDAAAKALPGGEVARLVHGLRGRLQIGIDAGEGRVIALTSAVAAEGKTSITAALAMSFAEAGSRVIAVDFDFVGRGLSRQLDVAPRRPLVEAVEAGDPASAVVETEVPGVCAVPASADDQAAVGRLSPAAVSAFLAGLGERADIVLIDTGPLLGAVESVLACSASSGVVLVVGRGTSRGLVRHARQEVLSLGVRLLGVVFNGAAPADTYRSMSSSSRSTSVPALNGHAGGAARGLGPVARSLTPARAGAE